MPNSLAVGTPLTLGRSVGRGGVGGGVGGAHGGVSCASARRRASGLSIPPSMNAAAGSLGDRRETSGGSRRRRSARPVSGSLRRRAVPAGGGPGSAASWSTASSIASASAVGPAPAAPATARGDSRCATAPSHPRRPPPARRRGTARPSSRSPITRDSIPRYRSARPKHISPDPVVTFVARLRVEAEAEHGARFDVAELHHRLDQEDHDSAPHRVQREVEAGRPDGCERLGRLVEGAGLDEEEGEARGPHRSVVGVGEQVAHHRRHRRQPVLLTADEEHAQAVRAAAVLLGERLGELQAVLGEPLAGLEVTAVERLHRLLVGPDEGPEAECDRSCSAAIAPTSRRRSSNRPINVAYRIRSWIEWRATSPSSMRGLQFGEPLDHRLGIGHGLVEHDLAEVDAEHVGLDVGRCVSAASGARGNARHLVAAPDIARARRVATASRACRSGFRDLRPRGRRPRRGPRWLRGGAPARRHRAAPVATRRLVSERGLDAGGPRRRWSAGADGLSEAARRRHVLPSSRLGDALFQRQAGDECIVGGVGQHASPLDERRGFFERELGGRLLCSATEALDREGRSLLSTAAASAVWYASSGRWRGSSPKTSWMAIEIRRCIRARRDELSPLRSDDRTRA